MDASAKTPGRHVLGVRTSAKGSGNSMLVPVIPGRPAIIKRHQWTIYLSVIDSEYLRQKAAWRQARAGAHPDAGGDPETFIDLNNQWLCWRDRQARYYSHWGLTPPDGYMSPLASVQAAIVRNTPTPRRALTGAWGWQRKQRR